MEQQIQQALQLLQEKGYRLSGRDLEVIPMLLREGSTLEEIEEQYLF